MTVAVVLHARRKAGACALVTMRAHAPLQLNREFCLQNCTDLVSAISEYEALLSRDKLFAACQLSHKERESILAALLKQAKWIEIYFAWRPNLRDEGDIHLIELAVAGGAHAIVTRNIRDFKNAELLFPDTKILTPKQCLGVC